MFHESPALSLVPLPPRPSDKQRKAEAEKQQQQRKSEPLKAQDVYSSESEEEESTSSSSTGSGGDSDDDTGDGWVGWGGRVGGGGRVGRLASTGCGFGGLIVRVLTFSSFCFRCCVCRTMAALRKESKFVSKLEELSKIRLSRFRMEK